MSLREIRVFGACEHNLQNVDVTLPRRALTVLTGLSGSGKSSLAFDTIYAEGQRRYVESLSAYARQFLEQLPKPRVERIEGLSPAISIEQKTVQRNPRSTVGTVTEIYDYLRLLYATVGQAGCPHCGAALELQTADTIAAQALALPPRTRLLVMAPVVRGRKGEYQALFQKSLREGFIRAKVDGKLVDLDPAMRLKKALKHDISIVVDRIALGPDVDMRVREAIRTALRMAEGLVILETVPDSAGVFPPGLPWQGERLFSEEFGCPRHGPQIVDMAPRVFSFNSRYGACPKCDGLGFLPEVDENLLIPDPAVSLRQGAIVPWKWYFDSRNAKAKERLLEASSHARQLFAILDAFAIDPEVPWNRLDARQQEVMLYGFSRRLKASDVPAPMGRRKKAVDLSEWGGVMGRIQARLDESGDGEDFEQLSGYLRQAPCPACKGARLRPESLAVKMKGKNIAEVCALTIAEAAEFFADLPLDGRQKQIAEQPLRQVTDRLSFLCNVGLEYLTLDRHAGTLSGGEGQRIRLATQIGARLTGVLYVLDEPSIGLHQRDNEKLIETLCRIRDQGNTVLVVEHDEQTIRTADYVVDLGPGAGSRGGRVVAAGTPAEVQACQESLTGQYLRGEVAIRPPQKRRSPGARKIVFKGCRLHNLRNVRLEVPLGLMVGITGVSGSGKSSLIMETLLPALMNHCYTACHLPVGEHDTIAGLEHIDRCINVDQTPIGRTPRSNPATYTKLFDAIREIFALTEDARARGFDRGRFSFNTKGGRCEGCAGQGSVKVEMNFLPDVYVTCESCGGKRYNPETLAVRYKGRSIADVLEMTVEEALGIFEAVPTIADKLRTLVEVGLGYLHLGQSALTLSGGEAQRIKLARELSRRGNDRSVFILDEPTTGLHFGDVHRLVDVLNRLVDAGSTVIVIEHQIDVIKCCDWVIDLGPGAGKAGGEILVQGPPEVIAKERRSETGRFLR